MTSSHGVVKGSMGNFPYAECHFVVAGANVKSDEERNKVVNQLIIDLAGNEKLYEDMKLEIDVFLTSIPPEYAEIRYIMEQYYVEKRSYESIANEMGYDRTTISKKIDRYLDGINQVSHNSQS